uniref:Receptor-like protein kinase isoform X1 n=1 Tax=Rhizophora mucronata TaxID=61149 RepID=A0A2P2MR10_RHIMU
MSTIPCSPLPDKSNDFRDERPRSDDKMLSLNPFSPKRRDSRRASLDSFSKPSFSTQPSILFPVMSRLVRSLKGRNKDAFRYRPPEPGFIVYAR